MTTPGAVADIVREHILSTATCTPATVASLTDLLLPKTSAPKPDAPLATKRPSKLNTTTNAKSKPLTAKARTKKAAEQENTQTCDDQLSVRERSILATEVINAALKSLSEAIKTPAQSSVRKQASSKDLVKATARKTLRRSNSLPQSPLQQRSLNRVASSPNISTRHNRSSSSVSLTHSGYRATAECARTAFACLRTLQVSKSMETPIQPLQIESGMSVLIGKLLLLGLDDLALKEIRILKRRLSPEVPAKKGPISKVVVPPTPPSLSELLDFGDCEFTGSKLGLVIATQLQILRLLALTKKYAQIEAALLVLKPAHISSPFKMIMLFSQQSTEKNFLDKSARHFQSLSDIVLSLCPSISSSEDTVAAEPKLSISPEVAIELQGIALRSRALWWRFAGHQGDASKDILDPILRCLSAFTRRSILLPKETYKIAMTIFDSIKTTCVESHINLPHERDISNRSICRLFGSLCKDAGMFKEAINWTNKYRITLDKENDSQARRCATIARLASLKLKQTTRDTDEQEILMELLDELEQPFRGSSADIDDLVTEISYARRAANGILAKGRESSNASPVTLGLRDMCESLVFMCPRLMLRYLGNSPDTKSATKDILRYSQRLQLTTMASLHSIDSILFLLRVLSSEDRLTWEILDSRLQECLLLCEKLDVEGRGVSLEDGQTPPAYHARISNLYYSQYLNARRGTNNSKSSESQQYRMLRRSIDCLRNRPCDERTSASMSTKLERMAEICKQNGRNDELLSTLVALRDELREQGHLSAVAELATSQPLPRVWAHSDEASVLARTLKSIVKVKFKNLRDSSSLSIADADWPAHHRAIVLENALELLSASFQDTASECLVEISKELLLIYNAHDYPIRRLRVLQQLVLSDLDRECEVVDQLKEELENLCKASTSIDMSEDSGLASYFVNLKLTVVTNLELRQELPNLEVLRQSIAEWSTMREKCTSLIDIEKQVEDVKSLLTHLNVIGDYLQVRGEDQLRLVTLRLILDIVELHEVASSADSLVLNSTTLGAQWLHLGYSGKAGLMFDRAKDYGRQSGVTQDTTLGLFVSYSQYLLTIGNLDKCEEQLLAARALVLQRQNDSTRKARSPQEKTKGYALAAKAYLVNSMLALERGAAQLALNHAKLAIKLLRRAWAHAQGNPRIAKSLPEASNPEESDNTTIADTSEVSLIKPNHTVSIPESAHVAELGPLFWTLVAPLHAALNFAGKIYAHNGMYLETQYYLREGQKLASMVGSESLTAISAALLGGTYLKAGMLNKGSECLMVLNKQPSTTLHRSSRAAALLNYQVGIMHGLLNDHKAEITAYDTAEAMINALAHASHIQDLDKISKTPVTLEDKMAQLTITKTKTPTTRKAPARQKVAPKRKVVAQSHAPTEPVSSVIEQCPQLEADKAMIMRQRARTLIMLQKPNEALKVLQGVNDISVGQAALIDQKITMAKQIIQQSMEQMAVDPVYSVLQESTLSFPAVAAMLKCDKVGDRLSIVKASPPPKRIAKNARSRARSKSPMPDSFFDRLRQAQEYLMDVHLIASAAGSISVVHSVATLLNSVTMLLSAFGQTKGKLLAHPGFASCSVETARNLALRRERKVIQAECDIPAVIDSTCWPSPRSSDARRSSVSFANDNNRFQQNYVDIIPKPWTAISIALSDSRDELSITKFQAGHSPFILRLPLGRHNSMDADEEVFGFEQGQSELLEIIQLANESAHDSRDMNTKEAKSSWWDDRNALDTRLRDLLENIEKVWLGGFTGIFSQHARRADLLARFQKSFQNILDRHLPSRRKTGKRGATQRITLDSRILELFVGLGDASDEESDFSEPLTDLLNFVVDVLQFHGEQNEYAEIDFDSIVIETQDALRGYHAAVHASGQADEGRHTILILDKALHSFPWESLPCMQGQAVSRLPSLSALRDRILRQQEDMPEDAAPGQYIHVNSGAYILNPSGDLKSTQTMFSKSLQGLMWDSIVRREPKEEEIKTVLAQKDLYLYFGHGSGAQYIRAKEIRKQEKCAVTWLMGCSSGALTNAGEFEPYGPAMNYMHAGCPALVGTLWDVTDKDIDRFAKSAFEHWGLLEKEVVGKAKGKRKLEVVEEQEVMSLVEAVCKGREVCNLRYLNAAAVVVYGVPVYFK